MSTHIEKRACPSCGRVAAAKAERFARPVTCKNCKETNLFPPTEKKKTGPVRFHAKPKEKIGPDYYCPACGYEGKSNRSDTLLILIAIFSSVAIGATAYGVINVISLRKKIDDNREKMLAIRANAELLSKSRPYNKSLVYGERMRAAAIQDENTSLYKKSNRYVNYAGFGIIALVFFCPLLLALYLVRIHCPDCDNRKLYKYHSAKAKQIRDRRGATTNEDDE